MTNKYKELKLIKTEYKFEEKAEFVPIVKGVFISKNEKPLPVFMIKDITQEGFNVYHEKYSKKDCYFSVAVYVGGLENPIRIENYYDGKLVSILRKSKKGF